MADTKISGLTALTGANTASGDLLTIVDVSDTTMAATGTNKKITLTELQGAPVSAGTANGVLYLNGSKVTTSGSALTFDGTTFSVVGASRATTVTSNIIEMTRAGSNYLISSNAASNLEFRAPYYNWMSEDGITERMRLTSTGLGIGTSSPGYKLDVNSGASTTVARLTSTGTSAYLGLTNSGASAFIGSDSSGNFVVQTPGSGYSTKLLVDSSGNLGIGTSSPVSKLQVLDGDITVTTSGSFSGFNSSRAFTPSAVGQQLGRLHFNAYSTGTTYVQGASIQAFSSAAWSSTSAPSYLSFQTTASGSTSLTERMVIDSSGNLGLGVTPSAWGSDTKAIQLGGSTFSAFAADLRFLGLSNAYWNGTNFIYKNTSYAQQYRMSGGVGTHEWHIAPSGTAGNAITFTQAMTLDASGNLLVGKTSLNDTVVGFSVAGSTSQQGAVASTLAGTTSSNTTFQVYSTGASAYRFYVGMQGQVYATNTTITAISDQRLKENIQDIDVGLNAIMALKPRKFDWKAGKGKDKKGDRGWIAQEFEQVFPDMVDTWKDPAPEGEEPYKAVNADLIPVLVKAIQEQQAQIEILRKRLADAGIA